MLRRVLVANAACCPFQNFARSPADVSKFPIASAADGKLSLQVINKKIALLLKAHIQKNLSRVASCQWCARLSLAPQSIRLTMMTSSRPSIFELTFLRDGLMHKLENRTGHQGWVWNTSTCTCIYQYLENAQHLGTCWLKLCGCSHMSIFRRVQRAFVHPCTCKSAKSLLRRGRQ